MLSETKGTLKTKTHIIGSEKINRFKFMHWQQDSNRSRFTQLRRWAAERLRRTPRAASVPSSPRLIRATRLRSASAENMASDSRNIMTSGGNTQGTSNSGDNAPRIVVNTDFDCSGARTRSGTNYLSRQPLKVIQPGTIQEVREQDSSYILRTPLTIHQQGTPESSRRIISQEVSQTNSFDQGNESRIQQIERQMKENRDRRIREANQQRAQNSYVHPLNGNFPPNNAQNQPQY